MATRCAVSTLPKSVRALLLVTGAVIFGAWGFRLFVLFQNWETDPFAFIHLLRLLASVGVGAFLLWVGMRGDRATQADWIGVILSALFTILFWGDRWIGLIGQPGRDTRERAHLHLASLFLVLGGLLLAIGWRRLKLKSWRAAP
jgi:hypothetical protein